MSAAFTPDQEARLREIVREEIAASEDQASHEAAAAHEEFVARLSLRVEQGRGRFADPE